MQATYFGDVPETRLAANVGRRSAMTDNTETAILAGGCFWGMQELLRHRDGVISTRVGYTGGARLTRPA